ncbi:MAG TPA: thioredoxin domain-containing protein, partial [Myxococcaceae bacterium]|nr:thioredoxin domain-containing protein [Myxococcaceae bacterium]
MSSSESSPPTGALNRLAKESSPYLRQHANNPVDWYPWGDEALELSRRENKPILLSIGYSACHWCHVMAHESFEDPAIAKLMNEYFVNIKVDREERPDLDQLYQGVVLLMGKGGGWPLTVFLTPELKPFFGGTYFPPQDKFGMPGFPKLLEGLHGAWTNKRNDVQDQAQQFESGLQHLAAYGLDAAPSEIQLKDLLAAGQHLEREVDRVNGGFGASPKFPNPMNVAMLLRTYRRRGVASVLGAVRLTLDKMALGGIYDQLGGGFHRYSVDDHWLVPHFEKMLYDNAQLLHLYSEAYQLERRPLWKKVVEETVAYVRREMTSPQGGFYATQDADSEGEEGKFFVWKPAELDALLTPEQAELVKLHFGVTEEGNFEHQRTVLEVKVDVAELAKQKGRTPDEVRAVIDEARRKLFEAREQRVKPGRDDKLLTGWNGLMIRGLALASRAFGRSDWADLAKGAADFVLTQLWKGGRLYRSHQDGVSKIDAFLEDYGDL